jgi:hypothetical protein
MTMIKTVSAALVAASLLFAPGLAASANAAPGATVTRTTTVTVVKKGPRFGVRHHRNRHVTVVRTPNKVVVIKRTRHGKIVKVHRHPHVVTKRTSIRVR